MKVVELELKRSQHREEEKVKAMMDAGGKDTDLLQESPKERAQARKQDRLLFVALHVLINLAEDVSVEKKMSKKNLTGMLSQMLNRKSPDALLLILAFLKKLSIFEENKNLMAKPEVSEEVNEEVSAKKRAK